MFFDFNFYFYEFFEFLERFHGFLSRKRHPDRELSIEKNVEVVRIWAISYQVIILEAFSIV